MTTRFRTVLALGYWVLGNICRYWVMVLLLFCDIFFHCDTQYDTDQTAVSTVHNPHDNHLDVCRAAIVSRGWQGVGRG